MEKRKNKKRVLTAYITYGGEGVNSSFEILSKFVASGQESASKTDTSHIRKPLATIKKYTI